MDRSRLGAADQEPVASFSQRLREKTRRIMAEPQAQPLSPDVDKELAATIKKWLK